MALQRVSNFRALRLWESPSAQNHQIDPLQRALMATETFPGQSLYAVAVNGTPDILLGNCHPKTGDFLPVGSPEDGEKGI